MSALQLQLRLDPDENVGSQHGFSLGDLSVLSSLTVPMSAILFVTLTESLTKQLRGRKACFGS